MVKVGKCIECGANRLIKQDICKKCRIFGFRPDIEEEEESED